MFKKILIPGVSVVALLAMMVVMAAATSTSTASASEHCMPTGYSGLTAKLINPGDVSGEVDATGCDVGVYYDSGSSVVSDAKVHGAKHYGVFANGDDNDVKVSVLSSQVYDIGDDPFTGSQHGNAVYYRSFGDGSATGTVRWNEVYEYQKGGIIVNGPGANVDVQDNEVTGLDSVPFIAQNGIQFGYGSTGSASNNVVDGNWYTGADWSSTGILVFQASNVQVTGNELLGNQVGVSIESWCYFMEPGSADNNQVNNNSIVGSQYGITVAAYDFNPYTLCDPSADSNRIMNNNLDGLGDGSIAIWVGVADIGGGTVYEPSADRNKVNANDIAGFDNGVVLSGVDAKAHANSVN